MTSEETTPAPTAAGPRGGGGDGAGWPVAAPTEADRPDGPRPGDPGRGPATFRAVPLVSLVAVGFFALGLSPIAFQGGPWFLVFLLPLVVAWAVVRAHTEVDGEALRVVSALGARRVPWDGVRTLRVVERGWVRAVRTEAPEARGIALVGVRPRDLGRLGEASGGRISMPTPAEVEAAREHERELEATRMRIARLREQQAGAGDRTGGERTTAEGVEQTDVAEPGTAEQADTADRTDTAEQADRGEQADRVEQADGVEQAEGAGRSDEDPRRGA